ncbi:MAG TPA: acetoacetate decarboxylase family protein [Streptosporangiaceae bacterium]|nr:acetoacetate decarboxylase family protein [Streptosporangiaceae bacterium]
MADVAGFFYPRTATGRATLLPAPPWYYSGDMLTVEYRTDPARVAELLPHPLAPPEAISSSSASGAPFSIDGIHR